MYFEKAGKENTEATLKIAKDEALKRGIKHIVVASTWGDTGLRMAQMLKGTGLNLIVVSHNVGFKEAGRLADELCVDGDCYDMILMEIFL